MSVVTAAHINLRGNARQALEFYQSVFGGNTTFVTYQDINAVQEPSEANQLAWGQVANDDGFRIMAYDVPSRMGWNQGENAFFVSLRGNNADDITAYWQKLSDGATIRQELGPAQWGPLYGMLQDKFGVIWVIDVSNEYNAS